MSGGRKRGSIGKLSDISRFVPVRAFAMERGCIPWMSNRTGPALSRRDLGRAGPAPWMSNRTGPALSREERKWRDIR